MLSFNLMMNRIVHVLVHLHVEVVQSLRSWINRWLLKSEIPFASELSFSCEEGGFGVEDIFISSKVWDWVVNGVASVLLWMLVLITPSRAANWIAIKLDIFNVPLSVEIVFSLTDVSS
jgi:hypothetical protein